MSHLKVIPDAQGFSNFLFSQEDVRPIAVHVKYLVLIPEGKMWKIGYWVFSSLFFCLFFSVSFLVFSCQFKDLLPVGAETCDDAINHLIIQSS